MIIQNRQGYTDAADHQPNFQLQLADSDIVYHYAVPTVSRAKVVAAQVRAKKEAATTPGQSIQSALSLEMIDLIFPNIVSIDGKTVFEVLEEYAVDDETQNLVVDKIVDIATGDKKDD